jgi:hypothetical protein
VTKEYQYALKHHKEVIPVRYRPAMKLPSALQNVQWVDFVLTMNFESTYQAYLDDLLTAIQSRIEHYNARVAARQATQQTSEKRRGLRLAGRLAFSTLVIVLLAGVTLRIFFPGLLHVPIFASAPTVTPTATPTVTPPPLSVGITRTIAGTYQGTYTNNQLDVARPAAHTLQIQIRQTGTQLSGTTTEDGILTASISGTIDTSGTITITETYPGGDTRTLHGSMVTQGQLSGIWAQDASSGTWDVSAQGPIPQITGSYQGTYTTYALSGTHLLLIQITQTGSQLSGTTTFGTLAANDSGTIDANGNFTITETFSGGVGGTITRYGSIGKQGQLSGTWGGGSSDGTVGGSGTWDVTGG